MIETYDQRARNLSEEFPLIIHDLESAHAIEGGSMIGKNAKIYEGSKIGVNSLILGNSQIEGQIGDGCIVYNSNLDDNSIIRDGVALISSYLGGDSGSSAIGKDSYVKYSKIGSKCAIGNRVKIEGAIISAQNLVGDDSEIKGERTFDRRSTTKEGALFRERRKIDVSRGYDYLDVNSALRNERCNGYHALQMIIEQMRTQDVSLTAEALGINKGGIVKTA